jgi:Xaa-Pro aminopeptidase
MAETDAAVFLVTSLPNVRYLTGFTGSAAVLVVPAEDRDRLLTNFLYEAQASDEVDSAVEIVITTDPLLVAARSAVGEGAGGRLVFESAHMSVADREAWTEGGGPELESVTGWVEGLRAIKTVGEQAAITRAAAVADAAFADILAEVRPGATERALAARLDFLLVAHGAERPAFDTIVAFGERSALPHAFPGRRTLRRGEIILFDFGAVVEGYASDVSRTVSCGEPDPRLREIYRIVLEAQQSALEGLRAGLTGRAADALARDPIEAAGYGAGFGHSLGHGIGLEVHEEPRLARRSDEELRAGMVVTVEPGIYTKGLGGVRIEDDVVVGSDTVEVLTGAPKDELIVF